MSRFSIALRRKLAYSKKKMFDKLKGMNGIHNLLKSLDHETKPFIEFGQSFDPNDRHSLKNKERLHFKDMVIAKGKTNPKVMSVGPGYGLDLVVIKKLLSNQGISPTFDVLGLQKSVSDETLSYLEGKDYSQNRPLEEIASRPVKYSELFKKLIGKYDFVFSQMSAGFYTEYPTHNLFFMVLMLAPGGEAYINNVYYNEKLFYRLERVYNQVNNTNIHFELVPEYVDWGWSGRHYIGSVEIIRVR